MSKIQKGKKLILNRKRKNERKQNQMRPVNVMCHIEPLKNDGKEVEYTEYRMSRVNWETKTGTNQKCVEKYEEGKEVVYIHSSSHLKDRRNLKGKLLKLLNNEFEIIIEARGGRRWDAWAKAAYRLAQTHTKVHKLHIILLGDNDARQMVGASEIAKSNLLSAVEKFGLEVRQSRMTAHFKNDIVFINGLIPFPIFDYPSTPQLVKAFYEYTKVMSNMVKLDPSIYFVPMKEKAINYCIENEIDLKGLFLKDNVHLSEHGETFLADHLATQIKAFRASKRLRMSQKDQEFYQSLVSYWDKDEIEVHFKLAKETNFFEKEFATLSLACSEKEAEQKETSPNAEPARCRSDSNEQISGNLRDI